MPFSSAAAARERPSSTNAIAKRRRTRAPSARGLGDMTGARKSLLMALALFQAIHAIDNVAMAREDLARATSGREREEHLRAARAAWNDIALPDKVARLDREFG
jgi:hypothetical protein